MVVVVSERRTDERDVSGVGGGRPSEMEEEVDGEEDRCGC